MKNMKRIVSLLLVVLMMLTGCGRETPEETTETQLTEGISVTYYHGNAGSSQFVAEETLIPKLTAQALLDLLIEQKVIPQGTRVRNFRVSHGIINLDVTAEFETEVQSLGGHAEHIMVGSLVNTFLATYEATGLELTTEGRILKTKRNIYDGVLEFFQ